MTTLSRAARRLAHIAGGCGIVALSALVAAPAFAQTPPPDALFDLAITHPAQLPAWQ